MSSGARVRTLEVEVADPPRHLDRTLSEGDRLVDASLCVSGLRLPHEQTAPLGALGLRRQQPLGSSEPAARGCGAGLETVVVGEERLAGGVAALARGLEPGMGALARRDAFVDPAHHRPASASSSSARGSSEASTPASTSSW